MKIYEGSEVEVYMEIYDCAKYVAVRGGGLWMIVTVRDGGLDGGT